MRETKNCRRTTRISEVDHDSRKIFERNSGFFDFGECAFGALSFGVLAVFYGFYWCKPVSVGIYELVSDDEYTSGVWC